MQGQFKQIAASFPRFRYLDYPRNNFGAVIGISKHWLLLHNIQRHVQPRNRRHFAKSFFVFWKFEQSRVSFLGPRWDIATTQDWLHSSYRRRALIFSWPCADAFFWGNGWMMTYAVNPLYIIRSGSQTIYESCKLKVPRFWQVQLWPGRRGCDEIISETSSCRFWCGSSSFHILYDVFGWFHPGLKNIFKIFWITVHPVDCCHCLFDKWS